MISLSEMRCIERNAMALGVPEEEMMERAGYSVAEFAKETFPDSLENVIVVSGTGNNGGDGYVAARHLPGARVVLAKDFDRIRTDLSRRKLAEWGGEPEVFDQNTNLLEATLIIDALLGTGAKGDLRPPYDEMVARINNSGAKVISVDAPSGLWANESVEPDLIVTFHDMKEGMEKVSDKVKIADIGVPKRAMEETGPGEFSHYKRTDPDSHKGMMGRVSILGGGPYPGAPVLAALGALRIGADLVELVVPGTSARASGSFPELIFHELPSSSKIDTTTIEKIRGFLAQSDVVIIGPGAGTQQDTLDTIRTVIIECKKPMVIDADAFKAVSGKLELLKGKTGVITPHLGEFEVLTGKKISHKNMEEKEAAVRELTKKINMTVLLKSKHDLIMDRRNKKVNKTGTAAMTVGGTGDVLAGIVGGLMARGLSPFNAARLGAYVNGKAGEMSFEKYSYSMGPCEMIECLPDILKEGLN